MKPIYFKHNLTVRKLKEIIKDWPEEYETGELTEVWIETNPNESNPVMCIWPLNLRDNGIANILLTAK